MNIKEVENFIDNTPSRRKPKQARHAVRRSSIVAVLAVLIGISMIASGAILSHYGSFVVTVNADASIRVGDANSWHAWNESIEFVVPESAPGGEKFCYKIRVKNQASVDADIIFDTNYNPLLEEEEIITKVYQLPEKITLTLENKNTNWEAIDDATQATLTFTTVSKTFDYDFSATGLTPTTEYCLIYYADKDPRFEEWGGNNPGAYIATFTTDTTGDIIPTSSSIDLAMNLPSQPDWNINPDPDYCDKHNSFDDYDHCRGAKIWLVPCADYDINNKEVINWNPETFLFETDLGVYFDCDLVPDDFLCDIWGTEVTSTTISSGETVWFLICYEFSIAIMPGQYTITTRVVPIV